MGIFKDTLKKGMLNIVGGLLLAGWVLWLSPAYAQTASTAQTSEPPAFSLADLPSEWHWRTLQEPLWDSQVFVLEAGREHSQSVLLVHGLGEAGFTDWLTVIPVLAEHYHVIALDLPGFGRSGQPATRYSPDNYARLLAWLVPQVSKTPLMVVGHSMGGAVSLRYAADYPHQVSKLVLVDTAGILERTAMVKANVQLPIDMGAMPGPARTLGSKLTNFGHAVIEKVTLGPDPTSLLNASDAAWNTLFAGRPNINAAMALSMHNFSDALDTWQKPTFLIWGEVDDVAPLRTGHLLVGQLPAAQLRVIEGAGHVPMKSHTAVFNHHLLQALQQPDVATREPLFTGPKQKLLHCNGEPGQVYTGHYEKVIINNCRGAVLKNLATDQLIINNSNVDLYQVRVTSLEGTGIAGSQSVINATNLEVLGEPAIYSDATRWDIAGMTADSPGIVIEVTGLSRFIFSVSEMNSAGRRTNLHQAIEAEQQTLDSLL